MPIEHTALIPPAAPAIGLTGEYFNSKDLSGQPVLTRTDRNINFNWDKVVPVKGLQRNNYSVRWSGTFTPPARWRLQAWRPRELLLCLRKRGRIPALSGWQSCWLRQRRQDTGERGAVIEAAVHFGDTQPHPIRLEYFHGTGSAGIDLTWQAPAAVLRDEAVATAKQSDVTIAMVGLSPSLEGEEMPVKLDGFSGGDRTAIDLPAAQEDLLKALGATGKPLIVVLQNGSALAVNWAQQHADAILEAWYPGEEGGTAIAETLAGDNNPAGRLPLTFYSSLSQVPAFEEYSMKGRTYRYFSGQAAVRIWLRAQLHELCLQQLEDCVGGQGRGSCHGRRRCEKHRARRPATKSSNFISHSPKLTRLLSANSRASSVCTWRRASRPTSASRSIRALWGKWMPMAIV